MSLPPTPVFGNLKSDLFFYEEFVVDIIVVVVVLWFHIQVTSFSIGLSVTCII